MCFIVSVLDSRGTNGPLLSQEQKDFHENKTAGECLLVGTTHYSILEDDLTFVHRTSPTCLFENKAAIGSMLSQKRHLSKEELRPKALHREAE